MAFDAERFDMACSMKAGGALEARREVAGAGVLVGVLETHGSKERAAEVLGVVLGLALVELLVVVCVEREAGAVREQVVVDLGLRIERGARDGL
jgi:hypothetical protein